LISLHFWSHFQEMWPKVFVPIVTGS